jgi:Zn-dependent protease/CBS domain-containing protein
MKWSIRVGRISGIDLYVHATFLILVAWLAGSEYFAHRNLASTLNAVGFILLLFAIIVLHELGHALAARKYSIATRDITLLPIGGVARLEKMPDNPREELVVAIAGPLVNFVIAGGLLLGIAISTGPNFAVNASYEGGGMIARLLVLNLWLAFFNLLPAFPMDGGRVLRALLAMRLSRERATEIAVTVGHAMALIFGAVGLWGIQGVTGSNPFLIFIALFIWIGADGELQQVRMHAFLQGIPVSQVMARDFETIQADLTLGELAKRLVPGFQSDYPVVEDGRLVGFVGLDDVVKGISEAGPDAKVRQFARSDFETAEPRETIEEVVGDLQPGRNSLVAVMDAGQLIGIVTPSNIVEHMMIRSAMQKRG